MEPYESPSPITLDLKSGFRRGAWTLRNSLDVAIGQHPAHVPIREGAAILRPFGASQELGFLAVEATADGARQNPAAVSVDAVPNLLALG